MCHIEYAVSLTLKAVLEGLRTLLIFPMLCFVLQRSMCNIKHNLPPLEDVFIKPKRSKNITAVEYQ